VKIKTLITSDSWITATAFAGESKKVIGDFCQLLQNECVSVRVGYFFNYFVANPTESTHNSLAMKFTALITTACSITATAFAGGSKEVIAPTQSAPSLGGWFIGGTYGQLETEGNTDAYYGELGGPSPGIPSLEDFEFDMYTLHIGRDLGTQVAGFDLAAYLEVGFVDGNSRATFGSFPGPTPGPTTSDVDAEIIPITVNLKLERALFGPVNFYLTGGLGYAFTEASAFGAFESGGGFYAQASAGLIYNVNSELELLAGGRWLHLSSLDFGNAPLELDDAFAWEAGVRVNF
jgi:hypothetical protein